MDQIDNNTPEACRFIGVEAPYQPVCLRCGYLLLGLNSHSCPECGLQYDPNLPETFGYKSPDTTWAIVWWGASLPLMVHAITVGIFYGYWFGVWADLGHPPRPYIDPVPSRSISEIVIFFNSGYGWIVWPFVGAVWGAMSFRSRRLEAAVFTGCAALFSWSMVFASLFLWLAVDPGDALNWYLD